jgi:hypothetical protein
MKYSDLQKQVQSKPKFKVEFKSKGGYVTRITKVPQSLSQNLGSLLARAGVPVPKES